MTAPRTAAAARELTPDEIVADIEAMKPRNRKVTIYQSWPRMILERERQRAAPPPASDTGLRAALERLLLVAFKGEDFLTQNGIPMEATPGVRRALRKARAALAAAAPAPALSDEEDPLAWLTSGVGRDAGEEEA